MEITRKHLPTSTSQLQKGSKRGEELRVSRDKGTSFILFRLLLSSDTPIIQDPLERGDKREPFLMAYKKEEKRKKIQKPSSRKQHTEDGIFELSADIPFVLES